MKNADNDKFSEVIFDGHLDLVNRLGYEPSEIQILKSIF